MAWNEPGKDKNPWGSGGGGNRNNGGPPDLDEALRKLNQKLNSIFGGGGGSGNRTNNGGGFAAMLPIVFFIVALIYVGAGFYQVDAKERAVILKFGAFAEIKTEGLNWNAPLITDRYIVNVTGERQYPSRGLMLTRDESIVDLPITVQYNVGDVKAFVLSVRDPETSLKHATDSAIRHVVGSTELNQVLSEGRQAIAAEVKQRLQTYLDSYQTGIQVINVNIQEARPPEEVRSAFDDVIRAKEDEARLKNQAQAYANQIIPEARGRAQRLIEEASAYKAEVIARAEGESDRFESLLAEYKRAPEVTRERLYIETLENVMTNSSKVMVDVQGGNNMLYLPLDRMTNQGSVRRTPLDTKSINEAVDVRPLQSTDGVRATTSPREIR
jgi:modulator of FtsH protease HflK